MTLVITCVFFCCCLLRTLFLSDNPAVINEAATRRCSPFDMWLLLQLLLLLLLLLLQDVLPV
jgi:hypothetical protein